MPKEGLHMKLRSFFVVALLFSSLTGCGGSYQVPTNNFDKVKTAFNGVEKSFKKISSSKKRANGLQPRAKNVDGGLNSLFSLFTNQDIKGHSIEDLSYNEPPMIQFQYLKAVFDKVGQGFEFGTKYYDNITGEIYVDLETGFKDENKNANNKYSFDYQLAIDITINDNDLINADVSFDIDLTQGNKTYDCQWYVNMLLDYDMEKASPTYSLTMLTENDEKNIPYFDRFTYEYDYVDVNDSQINEWRKLCMHSSERLVKDSAHQKLTDYIDKNNADYKVDYPKWFKNDNYYKMNAMPTSRQREVGDIMFDELGLNATDINADAFYAKSGTRNNVMQPIYREFSNIYGDEIIYNIVCRDEDDSGHGQEPEIAGIRAMMSDDQTGAERITVSGNLKIRNLFEDYYDPFGEGASLNLWYCDASGTLLSKITNTQELTFKFTTTVSDNSGGTDVYIPVGVGADTTFDEAYVLLKNLNNFESYSRIIVLLIEDGNGIQGALSLIYSGDFDFEPSGGSSGNTTFPKELVAIGVPDYVGENISYDFSRDGEHYRLTITGSKESEASDYVILLQKSGFFLYEGSTTANKAPVFIKEYYTDQEDMFLKFDYSNEKAYVLEVWTDTKQSGDPQGGGEGEGGQTVTIYDLRLVGSFNGWDIDTEDTRYKFSPRDAGSFMIQDVYLTAGAMFKVVANRDWTISNSDTLYGGYGYDDIDDVTGKLPTYLERGEGTDGNIVVKRNCTCSIAAYLDVDGFLKLSFKGFRDL